MSALKQQGKIRLQAVAVSSVQRFLVKEPWVIVLENNFYRKNFVRRLKESLELKYQTIPMVGLGGWIMV